MAAEFALVAGVVGVIGFSPKLWDENIKSDSISTADCTRQANSLQAFCDRVKLLQAAETELEDSARINAIASDTRMIVEELASQLAKCQLPPGQKGWKRYRDAIPARWRGMRLDADAQMRRLDTLRNGLQNSESFQKLDDDVKVLIEALRGQGFIKQAIDGLNVDAAKRHEEVLAGLRRLDEGAAAPPMESNADTMRRRKQARIQELKNRLFFDAMSRRHHFITPRHKKTFEWIFTGQRKTTQSNTTLMEWMAADSGLYWVSGRAGTGKSSLMRFLDDDPRTKAAFQGWAGERPLVLANFYFWNSEAAREDLLKSLSGLYRGIIYSLIKQDDAFAELLFPDHAVDERDWGVEFPTLPDMAQAFGRLFTAENLPAAVGLIIDGLDEYEAERGEQMTLAEMLCRAANSPNLKILVSSRPEAAFEAAFRDSKKLRLHELTEQDRRIFVSDSLKAVPRFGTIATEEEQAGLIDLVVKRSEGIFLWAHLAVETLKQEIGVSMDTLILEKKLEFVVKGIPSGDKELAQTFDHMLRNRIPTEFQLVGLRLIQTLMYGYTLEKEMIRWVEGTPFKHPITAILCSFFEDDIQSVLQMPVGPLARSKAASRIELTANLVSRSTAGLMELRKPAVNETDEDRDDQPLLDQELHFLHKDVAIYLDQPETKQFLVTALQSSRGAIAGDPPAIAIHTNLLKCMIIMIKLHNPLRASSPQFLTMDHWHVWRFTELAMRVARTAEQDDIQNTESLLDEMDKVMSNHSALPTRIWDPDDQGTSIGQDVHWSEYFPIDSHHDQDAPKPGEGQRSNFLSFAIEQGLFHYVQSKIRKDSKGAIRKRGRPLLSSACGTDPIWRLLRGSVQARTVELLIGYGADPNEKFKGKSCWQVALGVARRSETVVWRSELDVARESGTVDWLGELSKVLGLLLRAGANPYATVEWTTLTRVSKRNYVTSYHARTAKVQILMTFPNIRDDTREAYSGADARMGEDAKRIAELGRGLLVCLESKKTLRVTLLHGARALKERLNERLEKNKDKDRNTE